MGENGLNFDEISSIMSDAATIIAAYPLLAKARKRNLVLHAYVDLRS